MTAPKNRRVLVIDDNRSIHEDFRKILCPARISSSELDATEEALFGRSEATVEQTEFEVDSAFQGQDAVLLVKEALDAGTPYAMAFVDVRMPPGWDGVETTQKMWELDRSLQVVLCTAYSDYSWGELFSKLGQHDGLLILKKPFDAVEAFQLAHALTEKWWLHRQSLRKMEILESQVAERTGELIDINQALQAEVRKHMLAEEELRGKTALLEAQLNSSLDGILVVDERGKRSVVNQMSADLLKMIGPIEEDVGRDEELRMAAAITTNPEEFMKKVENLTAHPGQVSRDEVELVNGTVLDLYSSPVLGRDGRSYGRIWTFRDITERMQTEETLRLLSSAVQQSKESIVITDADLDLPGPRIVFVNPAFTEMTGYTEADTIGKNPRILQGPKTDRAEMRRLRDNLRRGEVFKGGTVNYRKDGSEFDMEWQITPIRNGCGKVTHHVAIQRDVSERKRVEGQLFQSQKFETVGKLAGGVAHEFNSILTSIIGQSELLLNDLPQGGPLANRATEIAKAAARGGTLTRQLLAYGRKQLLQQETIDLNKVISSVEGVVLHLMGNGVETRFIMGSSLNPVKADSGQLEQVIINMAMNAQQAMTFGGSLTILTANVTVDAQSPEVGPDLNPGDYVMLAISDTGTGMSDEVKTRAFEPFFTTKAVGQGTGLGLSTCYGIIRQSGGHITVQSEGGSGTEFRIYLPHAPCEPTTVRPVSEETNLPMGSETIVLVEEDPALRRMAAALLGRLGYLVLPAADRLEALSLLKQHAAEGVDLLLTDVAPAELAGEDLPEKVRAFCPDIRILFTSSYTDGTALKYGDSSGGIAPLQKPFTPSALAQKLREVLDRPQC